MKYINIIFTFLIVTLILNTNIVAQTGSGTWLLSSTTTTTATSVGNVTGQIESFSNMVINNYTGPSSSQRVTTTSGSWPAETGQNDTRYIQFLVSPNSGYSFNISSITLSLGASGGSLMQANIYYSTDPTFSTRTLINSSVLSLPNGSLSSLSYSPSVNINDGQTFYLRIYPWYTGSATGKYICPQHVVISGTTSGTTPSSGLTVNPTFLSFGNVVVNTTSAEMTYSLSGTNLTPTSDSITVTAPAGFQVSTTSGSGFSPSLKIAYSSGVLSSTLISARFSPTAVQGYSGSITNSGGGATTQNVAVAGTGIQNTTSNNRYVATNGLDTNPGTITQPYKTITKAVSVIATGDTIFVRSGTHTYSSTITISKIGSGTSRYYLFAYPGEKPLLDFSSESMGSRGISLTGSYWQIKGLDVKGAGDNGIYISGMNNVIELCVLYENRDSGLQLSGGASNNQVINCDSYFNADPTDYGDADGFAVKMDVGSGNYFYGCRSWQNVDDGWDGYLRGADNVSTTVENCWTFKNGYLKDGTDPGAQANGNGFKMGGSDLKDLQHNFTLINCLSFSNKVKGFDQNNNKGSMTLYNCTGYANGGNNYSISSTLATGKILTIKNCAELGGKVSLLSGAVQATNSWMLSPAVTNIEFISIDTALYAGATVPRNSDGSLPNIAFMHLASASRLIDAGTNIGLPFNGSAPDLGAFETSGPLPIQLAFFLGSYSDQYSIKLDWETVSETNNYGFYVEKLNPLDNIFETIESSFRAGKGSTLEIQHYSWTDQYPTGNYLQYRLKQIDNDGLVNYFGPISINPNSEKSIVSEPTTFLLNQNYPNPFNPRTTITFSVDKGTYTSLKVHDLLGREVASLFNGYAEAGKIYSVAFDAHELPSGLYFYRLQNANHSDTKKLLLMK